MKIQPLNDKVIIEPKPADEKRGSLYVPDTAKNEETIGTVRAVGPNVETLKVGQQVVYGKFTGQTFKSNDIEYIIVSQKDILAVFDEE